MRLIDADAAIDELKEYFNDEDLMETEYGAYWHHLHVLKVLESLPTAQQWIPCSERLPDNEKRVLCTVQSGEHFSVVPCIFIQHTRRWLPEVYGNHDNVIAWMPLPEPWNGGQDD